MRTRPGVEFGTNADTTGTNADATGGGGRKLGRGLCLCPVRLMRFDSMAALRARRFRPDEFLRYVLEINEHYYTPGSRWSLQNNIWYRLVEEMDLPGIYESGGVPLRRELRAS